MSFVDCAHEISGTGISIPGMIGGIVETSDVVVVGTNDVVVDVVTTVDELGVLFGVDGVVLDAVTLNVDDVTDVDVL